MVTLTGALPRERATLSPPNPAPTTNTRDVVLLAIAPTYKIAAMPQGSKSFTSNTVAAPVAAEPRSPGGRGQRPCIPACRQSKFLTTENTESTGKRTPGVFRAIGVLRALGVLCG